MIFHRMLEAVDRRVSTSSRLLARRTSRRSVIAKLGALLVGAQALPLLPVARAAAPSAAVPGAADFPEMGDPKSCDYWRYCAIDGYLCTCCGGTLHSCPPGTEPSPITWVGTCRNPVDGKDYVISYNDCCGQTSCGRCLCNRNEGDRPVYYPSQSNDILWCFGTESRAYHCSFAMVVEVA